VSSKPFFLLILGMVLWGGSLLAQVQNPRMPPMPMPQGQQPEPEDPAKAKLERELARKANQERQAALKRDTDKLLKLATELKDYVDKTNQSVLSLEVVKKAEEIEKLAHSVKEKMKAN
jgi:predicted  nucleic acid-binding Zn-ribbon protein